MKKNTNGVWEVTLGPVAPGAYRYNFNVDGVAVVDPRSPVISESNNNIWSLVYVPGAKYMDTRDVPHGAIASVSYFSTSLNRHRRMHIYYARPAMNWAKANSRLSIYCTAPPIVMIPGLRWDAAGFILDNLIAEKKAKPMVVVMPAGHTGAFRFGGGPSTRPGRRRVRAGLYERLSCPTWRNIIVSIPTGGIEPLRDCPWAAAKP